MLGILALLFLVVPIVEIVVFFEVASWIGVVPAVLWVIAIGFIGAWLVRREGIGALQRANQRVLAGELPTNELIDGILIVLAGALMLAPGFVSDVVGVLLLLPPSRMLVRRAVRNRFQTGPILVGRFPGAGGFGPGGFGAGEPGSGGGDVWDAESWEDPPSRRELG